MTAKAPQADKDFLRNVKGNHFNFTANGHQNPSMYTSVSQ